MLPCISSKFKSDIAIRIFIQSILNHYLFSPEFASEKWNTYIWIYTYIVKAKSNTYCFTALEHTWPIVSSLKCCQVLETCLNEDRINMEWQLNITAWILIFFITRLLRLLTSWCYRLCNQKCLCINLLFTFKNKFCAAFLFWCHASINCTCPDIWCLICC